MLKIKLSLLSLALAPLFASAQVTQIAPAAPNAPLSNAQETMPSLMKFSLESVKMPGNEKMGLLGGNYLLELSQDVFVGPAVYGSVSGKRGGLFVGGIEATWRKRLASSLTIEPGIYVGGGGGGSAGVGGGLMVRPHVDLLWHTKGSAYGLSVSEVRFPNGHINSNQIGLVASFDEDFTFTQPGLGGKSLLSSQRGGVGFDRIMLNVGNYNPRSSSVKLDGTAPGNIGYAGFRADQFLNENVFWGLEAGAFARGTSDGYAEVLGAVGVEYPVLSDKLKVGAVAALGTGGGGRIDVGGGALVKGGVYAHWQVTKYIFVGLEAGMADSPNGNFKSRYELLQVGLQLDSANRSSSGSDIRSIRDAEWALDGADYLNAARKGGAKQSLQTIGFVMNRDISDSVYLSGQAHSALKGNAGGFSIGLVGLGLRSPEITHGISFGVEGLVGAAGGGGVDSQGGAIVQAIPYANVALGKHVALRIGVGRVHSLKGEFNSTVANVALAVPFGLPGR
ncbi:hypothetical protein [Undibacterium sp. RuRC25W]|uniref:hypothetical protein n=1 Tax=Undibacterium sp. RuRC25W TaxID=3413047 RepID=UPI003BEF6EE4